MRRGMGWGLIEVAPGRILPIALAVLPIECTLNDLME
jgi:hypothetical protein